MTKTGKRASAAVFAAAVAAILLLALHASRNILWLMTAAICTAAHWQGYWDHNFVFAAQVLAIFLSIFSICWNIGGIIFWLTDDG